MFTSYLWSVRLTEYKGLLYCTVMFNRGITPSLTQGLLMFLGVDPYWVPQWWNQCLFLPYCHGLKDPLHCLLAQYMWRNSKKDVVHQIDIPQQTEEVRFMIQYMLADWL